MGKIGRRYVDALGDIYGAKPGATAPAWNYDDACWDFTNTLTRELMLTIQLPHGLVKGLRFAPHLHWIQQSANIPGWTMQWKLYKLGETVTLGVGGWTTITMVSHEATYTSGNLHQLTVFQDVADDAMQISDFLLIRLIRTPGSDAPGGAGTAKAIGLDCHVLVDELGSELKGTKHGL